MTYLLHIDTSAAIGTIAISGDGRLLAVKTNTNSKDHAAQINLMINDVLHDAGTTLQDLSGIVVCAGPGSYTGLRIGMATAKALCYVLDKPLLLDNKLTLLAYQQYHEQKTYDNYIGLLHARTHEYYVAVYDNKFNCTIEPVHIHIEELPNLIGPLGGSVLLTGEIDDEVKDFFKIKEPLIINNNQVDNGVWAMYALEQYKCNSIVNLSTAEPFYLKNFYTIKSPKSA